MKLNDTTKNKISFLLTTFNEGGNIEQTLHGSRKNPR